VAGTPITTADKPADQANRWKLLVNIVFSVGRGVGVVAGNGGCRAAGGEGI
jgi:hypothetical protein